MRIVAGLFRGRRLKTPKGSDTRPTQDRVRETIFNVLQHRGIHGRRVLDLYAGTGALGLEALSRGASSLVAVDHRTGSLLAENAALCGVTIEIVRSPMVRVRSSLQGRRFDLVFSDPPYRQQGMQETVRLLTEGHLLEDGAIIVLECDVVDEIPVPSTWMLWKEQRFGYTKVSYFVYRAREEA